MLRPFLDQPLIDSRPELLLEDAAEGGYPVAAQVGKLPCVVCFHVVCQYKAFERHFFPRHRMEECLQFFRCIVAAEQPYQFFVFQVPQQQVARAVRQVMADALHECHNHLMRRQLAAINRRLAVLFFLPVRVQVVQYAVLRTAYRVVEGVDHRTGIFQYLPLAVSHTGQEHDFTAVQRFFTEQAARQSHPPFPAEYDVVHSLLRITEGFPFLEILQKEIAVVRQFVAGQAIVVFCFIHRY